MEEKPTIYHGTYTSYILGFVLSLVLTFAAYFFVSKRVFSVVTLMAAIVTFGILQAVIQLILFLHLGKEPKPRWGLHVFFSMAFITFFVVVGSLWIMYNLGYHNMEMVR